VRRAVLYPRAETVEGELVVTTSGATASVIVIVFHKNPQRYREKGSGELVSR